jgi:hypothetical protein
MALAIAFAAEFLKIHRDCMVIDEMNLRNRIDTLMIARAQNKLSCGDALTDAAAARVASGETHFSCELTVG